MTENRGYTVGNMADDLTIEILKQIRDNTAETTQRLERLEHSTSAGFERMDLRLGRVEQGLLDLGKFMRQIALDLTKQERWHNHHVKVLEKDMSALKSRMGKLERKKGA